MSTKSAIYSSMAILALTMTGCQSEQTTPESTKKVISNTKASNVKEVKTLLKESNVANMRESGLALSLKSLFEQETTKNLCNNDDALALTIVEKKEYTLSLNECSDGESTISGKGRADIESDTKDFKKGIVTSLEDISLNDSENKILLKRDGQISFEASKSQGIWTATTSVSDFESEVNGVVFNVANLKIESESDKNNLLNEEISIVDGEVNLGEFYFSLDKRKSSIIKVEDKKTTGTIYLKDGAGHMVEIIIVNNKLSLKIDEDGDGKYTNNEILEAK